MGQDLKGRGKVYICGAGPGDPELLTIKAKRLLQICDVILYDRLVSKEILELAPNNIRKIYVGRSSGDPVSSQSRTNSLMVKFAKAGKKILRLKGGDPFIFGRGGEEAKYLSSNKIEYEIIPGIPSFSAAAVYAGIPLTYRKFSSSLAVVTGHEDPNKNQPSVKWKKLANSVDTIVVLMGIEHIDKITKQLIRGGLGIKTEVGLVENATTSKQKVILGKLDNIAMKAKKHEIGAPSIIIIGKVVTLVKKNKK
jgi:uroporphyrin-III C-methyltransferase